MKKSRKKALIITLSVIFTVFVIIPAAAIAIVKWAILPPEKLTPIVLKYTRPLVNGVINCQRVELTFWGTFPKVGLKLNDGEIISYVCKDSAALANNEAQLSDTLLKFSRATVTVDVMDYFRRDRVTVERLFIDEPFFYGLIDEKGRANWDVLADSGKQEEDTTASAIPVIDLKKLRIRNGHFIYEDRTSDLYTETAGFGLSMDNQLRRGNLKSDIKTGFESLIFDSPAYSLENDLSLKFESKVDLHRGKIAFADAKLMVNDLPLTADGEVGFGNNSMILDVSFGTQIDDIAKLLGFVPDDYFKNKKKTTTKGSLTLEGTVIGIMGDSISPDFNLHCVLDGASLTAKGTKQGIERLDTDLQLYLSGDNPSSSYISFAKLDMVGSNTLFSAKGKVSRLMSDPYIDATLKGRLDMGSMMEEILNPDSITVKGVVEADIEARFRLEDMMNGDLAKINAAGSFTVDRMLLADRAQGMSVFMRGVHFAADTTRQQSSYISGDDLIAAKLRIDTMNVRYGTEINTQIGRLDVQAKTSLSFDTTSVIPVTTNIDIGSMRARLPDSVWIAAKNIKIRGGIKPSMSDPKKGMFGGQIIVDTLRYFDVPARTRLVMDNSTFSVEMLPLRDAMRRQRAQVAGLSRSRAEARAGDSIAARPSREPGALRNRQQGGKQSGENTEPVLARHQTNADAGPADGLLRNWEVRGSVKFDAMRAFTGMFPLPVNMDNTTLRFDTDKINMTNARVRLGKSDLLMTGELSGMRRAMMLGGVLKGNLSLTSGYIDCNQLMRAISHSTLFQAEEIAVIDEEQTIELWEGEEIADEVPELDEDMGLFVVPANIDLVLKADARKVDFRELNLENIKGEIVVRNQSVNLRKLHMESNIGSGDLTMVYTAKDKSGANTGLELDLQDVVVEKFIGMFPDIDEMIPMLRSFEGVLDCQITATCELDSMVNVVFPSLHTACYLSGENMVLMDGETFAEISKKLMFKNKKRNLIDYISVDLLIKDNKVEIYPFMVELDRYKLAVGGIHNLDMTFDYHVSVLKSPVPFKLGLDIKGNLDDFKFKVVKCKYKELFKVAREEELQQTRLNLRSSIRESIRTQLLANAPELGAGYTDERIRSRRPENAVTDMDEDVDESSYMDGEMETEPDTEAENDAAAEPVTEEIAGISEVPEAALTEETETGEEPQ